MKIYKNCKECVFFSHDRICSDLKKEVEPIGIHKDCNYLEGLKAMIPESRIDRLFELSKDIQNDD